MQNSSNHHPTVTIWEAQVKRPAQRDLRCQRCLQVHLGREQIVPATWNVSFWKETAPSLTDASKLAREAARLRSGRVFRARWKVAFTLRQSN